MRARRGWLIPAGAVWASLLLAPLLPTGTAMSRENPFPRRIDVPSLPEGLPWLNTDKPLRLTELRGKFVLIDFWTYCCINCMHVLPELAKLEKAYPNELVVVGVHTAKFQAERDQDNLASAVRRLGIRHPVVNDADMLVWKRFHTSSWPTLWLLDPEGKAIWGKSGEATFEEIDAVLKKAVPYYRREGLLDEKPRQFVAKPEPSSTDPLRFPGKVLADEASDRLFIADSGHHRLVVTRLDGTLLETIGSGKRGRADGDFAAAEFNSPQGMAIVGDSLYVADTENHLIRRIDLAARRVATVAGTGQQLRSLTSLAMRSDPRRAALASPWALWADSRKEVKASPAKGQLYIAMAGTHQIWRMELDGSRIGPYAGNGREDIVDGPRLPREPFGLDSASFAQPSGLTSDGRWLYVADSEGSSIRAVPLLDPSQPVRTVVGTAALPHARLFTFGDADGVGPAVRLQHALGVAWLDGRIYVADTYNNKIKVVDPTTGRVDTLAGSGQPGRTDRPPAFDEPGGLSAAGGKLFVADTNNHLIRVVDPRAGVNVSTLSIPGPRPVPSDAPAENESSPP